MRKKRGKEELREGKFFGRNIERKTDRERERYVFAYKTRMAGKREGASEGKCVFACVSVLFS